MTKDKLYARAFAKFQEAQRKLDDDYCYGVINNSDNPHELYRERVKIRNEFTAEYHKEIAEIDALFKEIA